MTDINLDNSDQVNLKITYLTILQNIINRMSTFGIGMKTASVTALTALLAYSASDPIHSNFQLCIFVIPWLFFAGYHGYFLKLERTFRNLYNASANQSAINFESFEIDRKKLKPFSEKWSNVIFSKPFLSFHLILITIVILAFIRIQGIPCI